MSDGNAPSPEEKPSRRRGFFRKLFINGLCIAVVLTVFNVVTGSLADRWTASVPRDEATDVMAGAEPLWLGPPDAEAAVLMVHGFVGGSNNFGALPETLAQEGFRVRAMLLPGHGTDPREFAETPASEFPLSVLRELRSLREQHDRVYLVGHSMGGALSTLAAAMDEVDGLVLGAPYFGVTYNWYYVLPVETWTRISRHLVYWVYKSDTFIRVNREEAKEQIFSYRWIPANGSWTLVQVGDRASDPFVLEEITCPVLMMHGEADFAASYEASKEVFSLMASEDKTFVDCPKSDHHIFWDHDREMVIAETVAFLKRLEAEHQSD